MYFKIISQNHVISKLFLLYLKQEKYTTLKSIGTHTALITKSSTPLFFKYIRIEYLNDLVII